MQFMLFLALFLRSTGVCPSEQLCEDCLSNLNLCIYYMVSVMKSAPIEVAFVKKKLMMNKNLKA
jgi:hypothetical protein